MSGATEQQAQLHPVEEAIKAIAAGEVVVVVDDQQRENEGDLVCAAEKVTPEIISFMARYGRGLICVAMVREDLMRLGLARMLRHGDGDRFGTAFMESVDAREGISTGISAHDRARTIQVLVDQNSGPQDLVRPGHVFPLEAAPGGVLRRPGHTEAAVDLARLAGLRPAGVICEIMRDDGSMARLPELIEFAHNHGLKIISIEDLKLYRRYHEKIIHLEQQVRLPTDLGMFRLYMYRSDEDNLLHLALTMGEVKKCTAPLVRVHSECLTGDVFGSLRCDCGSQLRQALKMIAQEGCGAVLYLRQEGRGIGLGAKIHAYALQERGLDTVEANETLGFAADARDYAVAAQILHDLGVSQVRLLTNNPAKLAGLEKAGIRVVERVPLIVPRTQFNERYLEAKKSKLGHLL